MLGVGMDEKWKHEMFFQSLHNFADEIYSQNLAPREVKIFDLSLDENGEGMAGAYLTEGEKIEIAETLDSAGIQRIGLLGFPEPVARAEVDVAKKIAQMGFNAEMWSLASTYEDVQRAIDCGLKGTVIRCKFSDLYTAVIEPVEKRIEDFVKLAKIAGDNALKVGIMAQDITRTDLLQMDRMLNDINSEVKLDEICLADSQGIGNPLIIRYLVSHVKKIINVPIQVHCHNHVGLGTANACSAVTAGAEVVHTTVNGYGHFAGLSAMEEVAVALKVAFNVDIKIDFSKLYALSKKLQEFTGIYVQPHKAIVGEQAFSRSEEIKHINELVEREKNNDLKGFYPFLPEFVGQQARVVMAEKVTLDAVMWNLKKHGVKISNENIPLLFEKVKDWITENRRAITDDTFEELAMKYS